MMLFLNLWILITLDMLFVSFLRANEMPKTINFGKTEESYRVLEGDSVNLVCGSCNTDSFEIYTNKGSIVEREALVADSTYGFEFVKNATTCILEIKRIEKKHEDTYYCLYPLKSLKIEVIYTPSNIYPVCSSSVDSYTFFDQEQFNFSCISGYGNPPINMSLFTVYKDGDEKNITKKHSIATTRMNDSVSLYYSTCLDSSFHNKIIVCSVTQQLPAPYESYEKSCSFGPLILLRTFSVSIYPSTNYTLYSGEPENITFTCSSNVSEVILEWTNIPLKEWQYRVSDINDSHTLTIFNYGSERDKPVTVECTGIYGGRNVSEIVNITNIRYKEYVPFVLPVPFIIMSFVISCVSIIAGFIVYTFKRGNQREFKAPRVSSSVIGIEFTPPSDGIRRSNECTNKGDSSNNPDTVNGNNNDTDMIENPIYGSARKEDQSISDIDVDRNSSHSGISMIENIIYESYDRALTKCITIMMLMLA